jgi:3-oxoacyl-ACP reductase-like protein
VKTLLEHRRPLFWDIPEHAIKTALQDSPEWVISRVFEYGSIADIDALIAFYGTEKIKTVLSTSNMKPITRSMAFLFLGFDPEGYYAA